MTPVHKTGFQTIFCTTSYCNTVCVFASMTTFYSYFCVQMLELITFNNQRSDQVISSDSFTQSGKIPSYLHLLVLILSQLFHCEFDRQSNFYFIYSTIFLSSNYFPNKLIISSANVK